MEMTNAKRQQHQAASSDLTQLRGVKAGAVLLAERLAGGPTIEISLSYVV